MRMKPLNFFETGNRNDHFFHVGSRLLIATDVDFLSLDHTFPNGEEIKEIEDLSGRLKG